jgi:hypothetical protein
LVVSGRVPASRFLELLGECRYESEYIIWSAVDAGLGSIAAVLDNAQGKALRKRYNTFVIENLRELADRLGWSPAEGEGLFFFFGPYCKKKS